jgi:putative zinc finger/helix-turn-helix YgiT family protein
MQQVVCPYCEKETNAEYIKTNESMDIRGEHIIVPVEYFRCLECGGQFDDPTSDYDPLVPAYEEYRRRHSMLQPKEIRSLRKQYGLSQKEFARLLGWGEITLSRYENGALQDEAHDTTMKLLHDNPSALITILENKGDFLPPNKRHTIIFQIMSNFDQHKTGAVFQVDTYRFNFHSYQSKYQLSEREKEYFNNFSGLVKLMPIGPARGRDSYARAA